MFEQSYREWRRYVGSVVRRWCANHRDLVELDHEEIEAEAWSHIWRHWGSVQKARRPVVAAALLAKQWCQQREIALCGRWVMARGKRRFWSGTRRHSLFAVLGDDEVSALKLRRSREMEPVPRAMIHEVYGDYDDVAGFRERLF